MESTSDFNHTTYSVQMRGKFTFADHFEFRNMLAHIGRQDVQSVILDMSQVEFVDSAALGMLLLARDEAHKFSKSLIIKSITGQVKKMFDMARFDTLFTVNE